jgi:hypothetical protein
LSEESREFINQKATADSVTSSPAVAKHYTKPTASLVLDDMVPQRNTDLFEISNPISEDLSDLISSTNETVTNKAGVNEDQPAKALNRFMGNSNFEFVAMFLLALLTSVLFASKQARFIYQVCRIFYISHSILNSN